MAATDVPKRPESPRFEQIYFLFPRWFNQPGKIAGEYGSKIRRIYIQVQKVHFLYLFLENRRILLKKI